MPSSDRIRTVVTSWGPGVMLGLLSLVGYGSTLAPTVLDGDAALFQYLPTVAGVAYPTGYPTYILIGRIWQTLVPLGSIAWRMNAFSAVCAAVALVLIFRAFSHLLESRIGGAAAAIWFGTLPTFWRWATESKSYTLHLLFLALMLHIIGVVAETSSPKRQPALAKGFFWLLLVFAVSLGNHNTTILLAPGLALLYWLNGGKQRHDSILCAIAAGIPFISLPLFLYAYVPLRANYLLAKLGTVAGLPVAVLRGLVSDFYHPSLLGLWRFFTAADFTGGVVTNWGLVPGQLRSVYWPLIRDDFTAWGIALAAVGAVYLGVRAPRRFWPLFLIYCVPIPFVLTYGQGEQSAFLLPSNLMVAGFAGAAVSGAWRGLQRVVARWGGGGTILITPVLGVVLLGLASWWPLEQATHNIRWLEDKWTNAQERYWRDTLSHPIDAEAGLMAHWGDLTTMWYVQHVEGIRADIFGLYPPSASVGKMWLQGGHPLYVAGPLQGWGEVLLDEYQIVPWGRMIRVVPPEVDSAQILPSLKAPSADVVFGQRAALQGMDFPTEAQGGHVFPVTLTWEAVDTVPANASISLRLVSPDGITLAQADEALLSGWLPSSELEPGQGFLSYHAVQVPAGTWPGDSRMEIALFDPEGGTWTLRDGGATASLGQVRVTPDLETGGDSDPWDEYKTKRSAGIFGGQIRLAGYDYSVTRAGQGKGFTADFLWQTVQPPAEDYSLCIQLVETDSGRVLREWRHNPTQGVLPTSHWMPNQLVRDSVDLVLPADTPPGEGSTVFRVAWMKSDGDLLSVSQWRVFPGGDAISLPGVRVVEKEDRVFDPPQVEHAVNADFDEKIRLIGYDIPSAEVNPGGTLTLNLTWQSLTSEMDKSYTVFVHLVDEDDQVLAQGDKEPGYRSKQPTTSWVKGEIVIDPISVGIPQNLEPGTYDLRIGLYLAPDGPRLPTLDPASNIETDSIDIVRVEVKMVK
jgi:hypothetical protein